MDLADFPHLKKLALQWTDVTGDIREIGKRDFSELENSASHLMSTVERAMSF